MHGSLLFLPRRTAVHFHCIYVSMPFMVRQAEKIYGRPLAGSLPDSQNRGKAFVLNGIFQFKTVISHIGF